MCVSTFFRGLVFCLLMASVSAEELLPYTGEPRIEVPIKAVLELDRVHPVGDKLRIATYNIENFTDGFQDGPERSVKQARWQTRDAAKIINTFNPDILVLQEIENRVILNQLNLELEQPYGLGFVTQLMVNKHNPVKINLAVLSRVELKALRELEFSPLSGRGRPARGLLSFYVDLGDNHRLLVYVVHLKSNWGVRKRNIAQRHHAMQILRRDADYVMGRYPDFHWEVMVLGDMNVDPAAEQFADDPSLDPVKDWVDLWKGVPLKDRITIPTRYGDRTREHDPATFDRIIASQPLTEAPWKVGVPVSIQQGVHTEDVNALPGEEDHVSDHYPVYVDILR